MSGPSFRFRMPPASMFSWPPDPIPAALPPPRDARTFASPFPISADIYNSVLSWKVPVTIGFLYASTAIFLNRLNRERGYRPWSISKTRSFHYFVLAHNIFLAVFSALTFVGMIRALAHTWPSRRDLHFLGKFWPGLRTQNGLAGAADALCKLHGPRGFGDAVSYNSDSHTWTTTNRLIQLGSNGNPENDDIGRLWNEGLAFWGWWFYLSKFYEVLDTFIILAKGKRSSTLQTYHHTGAMACMWAGIRYMSPPIWMFAFLNSGIHALMYTYYTLSALRIRVPQRVKRTLTTMQISQFLIGITFALMHLFVIYSVPVSVPYSVTETIKASASSVSSAVASAMSEYSSETSSAIAAATGTGIVNFIKKAALRAAGEEGMAARVGTASAAIQTPGSVSPPDVNINLRDAVKENTKFRTQYTFVPCIDTNGQAFAIWLNVFYLAPLTLLFVRFFIRSYSRRGLPSNKNPKNQTQRHRIEKAAEDAAHGVDRELNTYSKAAEKGVSDFANNMMSKANGNNSTPKSADKRRVSATIEQIANTFEKGEEEATNPIEENRKNSGSLKVGQVRKKASAEHNNLRKKFEGGERFGQSVENSPVTEAIKKAKNATTESLDKLQPYAEEAVGDLERRAEETVRSVREAAGGQASRPGNDFSSHAGDTDSNSWASKIANAKSVTDMVGDIGQDATAEANGSATDELATQISEPSGKDQTTNPSDTASITSAASSAFDSQVPTPSDEHSGRSPSPTPSALLNRTNSPVKKSKIPKSASNRNRSPTKKILTPSSTTTSATLSTSPASAAHSMGIATTGGQNGK